MTNLTESAILAAALIFIGASDSILASDLTHCDRVELEAAITMSERQRGVPLGMSPMALDASDYPLFSHVEDQATVIRAFAEKHRNQCRLQDQGITLNIPWDATRD